MRLFFGMILGALITIGGTYIADSTASGTGPGGVPQKPMVNWDVVSKNVNDLAAKVREQWNKLTG